MRRSYKGYASMTGINTRFGWDCYIINAISKDFGRVGHRGRRTGANIEFNSFIRFSGGYSWDYIGGICSYNEKSLDGVGNRDKGRAIGMNTWVIVSGIREGDLEYSSTNISQLNGWSE